MLRYNNKFAHNEIENRVFNSCEIGLANGANSCINLRNSAIRLVEYLNLNYSEIEPIERKIFNDFAKVYESEINFDFGFETLDKGSSSFIKDKAPRFHAKTNDEFIDEFLKYMNIGGGDMNEHTKPLIIKHKPKTKLHKVVNSAQAIKFIQRFHGRDGMHDSIECLANHYADKPTTDLKTKLAIDIIDYMITRLNPSFYKYVLRYLGRISPEFIENMKKCNKHITLNQANIGKFTKLFMSNAIQMYGIHQN